MGWIAFLASRTPQKWISRRKRLKNDLVFHQTGHWKFKMRCPLPFEYELYWIAFLASGTPQLWIYKGKRLKNDFQGQPADLQHVKTYYHTVSNLAAPATGNPTFTRLKHDEKHTYSLQIFAVWLYKPPEHSPLGSLFQCCLKKIQKIAPATS